ncbi:MAG: hypothetical protein RIR51_1971 [Bacteroidota bacterium]|jgi:single-strand DNA-binding protein
MASLNKVMLIGNLGSDPEVRSLPSGTKVASFNIATNESYVRKDGQRVDNTDWHRIEMWDGLAGIAEQYLRKGSNIYVEGRLRVEEYQDKNGNTVRAYKIRATEMQMLGGRNGENNSSGMAAAPKVEQNAMSNVQESNSPSASFGSNNDSIQAQEDDDDLPF